MSRTLLDDSHDHCERLTKRTAGNFYYSFLGLPTAQYQAMCTLYAFMRVTDDWGDDSQKPIAHRLGDLDAWQQSLSDSLRPDWTPNDMTGWSEPARAVLPALRDVATRFAIPHEHLFAVLDGVRSDLSQAGESRTTGSLIEPTCRFETFEQLREYCYLVAGAVGLCCIHIWGFREGDEATSRAIDCGTAFQLTNILRDVGEDAAVGRIYLPKEDLARFQITTTDLVAQHYDGRFRELMSFEAGRAKTFYASAEKLLDCLEPHGRPILKAMFQLYGGLLREIERRKFDVFSQHVSLPRWRKLWIAADALIHQKLIQYPHSKN